MQIDFSKREGRVPVTIMHLSGDLDASNYTEVIAQAQAVFSEGIRDLLIDMSRVPYVSSAGLMSLHAVVLIFAGISREGGSSSRAINIERDGAVRQHVKLINPQAAVDQVLEVVGLKQFFEVHTDLETAIMSF